MFFDTVNSKQCLIKVLAKLKRVQKAFLLKLFLNSVLVSCFEVKYFRCGIELDFFKAFLCTL